MTIDVCASRLHKQPDGSRAYHWVEGTQFVNMTASNHAFVMQGVFAEMRDIHHVPENDLDAENGVIDAEFVPAFITELERQIDRRRIHRILGGGPCYVEQRLVQILEIAMFAKEHGGAVTWA